MANEQTELFASEEQEKNEVSFEENIRNLEKLVKELESGEVDLDNAINKYTEAMKIAKVCSDKLSNAQNQINKILNDNGQLEDFEVKE